MFKKQMSIAMAMLMFSFSAFAGVPLTRGTQVPVRIMTGADSKKSAAPTAVVENDVKDSAGKVLISKGATVNLDFNRQRARGCGRPGSYELSFRSVQSVDGQNIALEGNLADEGENRKGRVIGLGVGLGWFVWPCLFILCKKGGEATLPAGQMVFNVMVATNYTIE